MNVSTITMPPEEAKARLRRYRASVHRTADEEYQLAEKGYRALARGTPILNLVDAIASAPVDGLGRPRLAVARADRRQVRFRWWSDTATEFDTAFEFPDNRLRTRSLRSVIPMGRPCPAPLDRWLEGYALVPMIPPEVRQDRALDAHFILWEVEAWADKPIGAQADRDPYLLRHLAGDLYAVVGEWDLTELERAVMASRARG